MDENTNKLIFMVVGSCLGILFGVFAYFIKGYFEARKEKIQENKNEIKETREKTLLLSDGISNLKAETNTHIANLKTDIIERDGKIETEFLKLNTKIEGMIGSVKDYQTEISKLDGRINEHFNLVSAHISTIAHMSKQIDALFKIIEGHTGPRRMSDGG